MQANAPAKAESHASITVLLAKLRNAESARSRARKALVGLRSDETLLRDQVEARLAENASLFGGASPRCDEGGAADVRDSNGLVIDKETVQELAVETGAELRCAAHTP